MFQIQDTVSSAVVEALALPLSSREQRLLRHDVPASAEAYGHYLRANRLSATSSQWSAAAESYQRAVEADPYWAQTSAGLGDHETAIELLSRAVDTALHCVPGYQNSPLLSALRPLPAFAEILDRARVRQSAAERAFIEADGPRLLGLSVKAH